MSYLSLRQGRLLEMVTRIISGAQTGADRAGLDAALALGLETGGWIPFGRRTDEGPLPYADFLRYKLKEHASALYPPRTEQNVLGSDGTVLFGNMTSPGCRLTIKLCRLHHKPFYAGCTDASALHGWLHTFNINVLNIAGNRERTNPGIYQITFDILMEALR